MADTSPQARRKMLDPSALGTKEYWDEAYSRELRNNVEDAGDEGTVWFEESGAEDAILKQLDMLVEKDLLERDVSLAGKAPARFLDLGTGNGHLLFSLREEDEEGRMWAGEMVGLDYSETSIHLARRIGAQREETGSVRFERWDLLSDHAGDWLQDGFDVVLDKGTFDAISLMPSPQASLRPCDVYRSKVVPLIKDGHFFIITSCNWTKEELLQWLCPAESELVYYAEAKYPTFTFGGRVGQSIVTLLLQKREMTMPDV